ncbi:Gustatory receptor 10 [Cephus cinctus]|uniref:Gustatory receptor n=1 Tax=Cephus cinctus TaxID=211228 RepID=A0A3L9LU15_CEPCN|nr:uncharacterized protein LOC107271011 isoform X3 [Cephus cinctus]RLZ02229.1 Gustatory receptor 10 [Cephus cinctus]
MILLTDIKPLFYINLLFGNPPHVIFNNSFAITKLGSICSLLWSSVFLCYGYKKTLYIVNDANEIRSLILKVFRLFLVLLCIFNNVVVGYYSHKKLCCVTDNLRSYDLATKIGHTGNRRIRYTMWTLVTVRIICCIIVGYTYHLYHEHDFLILFRMIEVACFFLQIDKFMGIVLLLYSRFRHLNELLLTNDVRVNVHVRSDRGLRLQDAWWLHNCLMDAAEILNSTYSMQLLFWITTITVNITSRIYIISEAWSDEYISKFQDKFFTVYDIITLVTLTTICHVTADQANKSGPTIFSSSLAPSRKFGFATENIEVGMYFKLRQLEFSTNGGSIRVNLPLLLSISAGITTFLVILSS